MNTLRRYFLDTEFYPDADGHSHPISFGLIEENDKGPGFYAVASEFNTAACTNKWINEHVVSKLADTAPRLTRAQMADGITNYIQPAKTIEFWARNGSYDFYHLCQTFGDMGPMTERLESTHRIERIEFRDLEELFRAANWPKLPKPPKDVAHTAIVDATWERNRFPELVRRAAIHQAKPTQMIKAMCTGFKAWLKGPHL